VDFETSQISLNPGEGWDSPLHFPVEVFGNTVQVSRGESVFNEILGSGNANVKNQTFILKKSPLTYLLAPTIVNDQGIKNTLSVYVNGVKWTEVNSFFGTNPEDEVYIVRQNDEGKSLVIFGDGIRGRRLTTGVDNVRGDYRFGAGKAHPSAGTITQIDTPVPGLKSIINPIPAYGGADAEDEKDLRTHAPDSALILGRAISIPDMEAVILSMPGVRAIQSEWRWHGVRQSAVALFWYLGEPGIKGNISQRLGQVCDPTIPIQVEQAQGLPVNLIIDIETDPRYLQKEVIRNILNRITNSESGRLAPENIGIGKPLFRSELYKEILSAEGTISVLAIFWNGDPFISHAQVPPTGFYFDFEQGSIQIKGIS
ncbi:MAG: hypothetical protein KDD99_31080, partial [Bacteroidetes bacterium]|nr:hypothetical protein [Bacteroidota bacterium]